MTGIEFLEQARRSAPDAKLVLLTAYADTDVAIKAINDIGLDYYLLKPWDPPEERLYPVLDDLLSDWREAHPDDSAEVRVVGHRWSERSHEIKTFLARNHVPYRWLDLERDDEARPTARRWHRRLRRICRWCSFPTGSRCGRRRRSTSPTRSACGRSPSNRCTTCASSAADRPGSRRRCTRRRKGCRPSSSSAKRPAARPARARPSRTTSGFPKGLSGADLTHRAVAQARRFGAEMVLARDVVGLRDPRAGARRAPRRRGRDRGADRARRDRRVLPAARGDRASIELTGRGVYYGATASEARSCEGDDVYVVGAANSAGQAALNLARFARRVVVLVRSDGLEKSMSRYLVERIRDADNIEVRLQTEVVAGHGNDHLEEITIADHAAGTKEEVATNWLFVFIGASPRTDWLGDEVARDERGFVITGPDLLSGTAVARWPLTRAPVHAGDERARRVRRRRRAARLDEAGRVGGR